MGNSMTTTTINSATTATATTTTNTNTTTIEYLTLYRSGIYYLTFIAILAVDFPVFPRRFGKTDGSSNNKDNNNNSISISSLLVDSLQTLAECHALTRDWSPPLLDHEKC